MPRRWATFESDWCQILLFWCLTILKSFWFNFFCIKKQKVNVLLQLHLLQDLQERCCVWITCWTTINVQVDFMLLQNILCFSLSGLIFEKFSKKTKKSMFSGLYTTMKARKWHKWLMFHVGWLPWERLENQSSVEKSKCFSAFIRRESSSKAIFFLKLWRCCLRWQVFKHSKTECWICFKKAVQKHNGAWIVFWSLTFFCRKFSRRNCRKYLLLRVNDHLFG